MKSFTKTVVTEYTPLWVRIDFTTFSKRYEEIRERHGRPLNSCFKCERKFEYGDTVGLACFIDHGNEVLCVECATELNKK